MFSKIITLLLPALAASSFCDTTSEFTSEWVEDFTSLEIDTNIWEVITGSNGGACRSAMCKKENTYIENGNLVMKSERLEDGTFTTGALWTKNLKVWNEEIPYRLCVNAILPGTEGSNITDANQGIWPGKLSIIIFCCLNH